jgi:DNA-binding Lrp family transcriptional regulator
MDRFEQKDELRKSWIDQFVKVNEDRPELKRFAGIVGRVITVNYNGKAIVDFQDGAWYDIPASDEYLTRLDAAEGAKYKNVNSAQVIPETQG